MKGLSIDLLRLKRTVCVLHSFPLRLPLIRFPKWELLLLFSPQLTTAATSSGYKDCGGVLFGAAAKEDSLLNTKRQHGWDIVLGNTIEALSSIEFVVPRGGWWFYSYKDWRWLL